MFSTHRYENKPDAAGGRLMVFSYRFKRTKLKCQEIELS